MAEVVALASAGAGLASLSLQLTDSIIKLRDLHRAYKDATMSLENTASDLEILVLTIQQVELYRLSQVVGPNDLLERCIASCQRSVTSIRNITGRLENLIKRTSFIGKLKTATEAKQLASLQSELERAKTSLMFACQVSFNAHRQTEFEQLHHLLEVSQAGSAQGSAVPAELAVPHHHGRKRTWKRERQAKYLTLRFRPWFSRMWEVSLCRAMNGWAVTLCPVNVLPEDSLIFELCREGNSTGVQRLIEEGKASIHDQTAQGEGLIEMAILFRHAKVAPLQLVRILFGMGAPVVFRSIPQLQWPELYELCFDELAMFDTEPLLDGTIYLDFVFFWIWSCCMSVQALRAMQSSLYVPWCQIPPLTRYMNACKLQTTDLGVFQAALGPITPSELAALRDPFTNEGILHQIDVHRLCNEQWRHFFLDQIQAGAPLYEDSLTDASPLRVLLMGLRTDELAMSCLAVENWTMLLQDAKVELVEYGRMESESLTEMPILNDCYEIVRLVYGSDSRDWDLLVKRRQTLDMWEPNEIPGSWLVKDTVPRALLWKPHEEEDEHLIAHGSISWRPRKIVIHSDAFLASQGRPAWEYDYQFAVLKHRAHDDSSAVYRALGCRRAAQDSRHRSRSAMPDLQRRDTRACHRFHVPWVAGWNYHRCRLDRRWKLTHSGSWREEDSARRCMAGKHDFEEIMHNVFEGLGTERGRRRRRAEFEDSSTT